MNAPIKSAQFSEVTEIPLLGRAAQMMGQRMVQVFGSVSGSAAPSTYNPEVTLTPGWTSWAEQAPSGHAARCVRLWRVSSAGQSVQRFTGDGASSLPFGDFHVSSLPANASFAPNGFFKIALDVGRATGNARYFMDVGETLDIYAYSVELTLVGPDGTFEITPNAVETPRQGVLIDARIGVEAAPIESPIGNRRFKFTQHFAVTAATQVSIPIPRSTVGVKIYQSPAGVNSGDWTRFIGDPAIITTAFPTSVVSFANRASLEEHRPIGDETHLVTDRDDFSTRLFTIVWEIEP